MARQMTNSEIREYHGHGMGNRRVRIGRDSHVTYYGSTIETNREDDWWHEGGWAEDYRIEDAPGREDSPLGVLSTSRSTKGWTFAISRFGKMYRSNELFSTQENALNAGRMVNSSGSFSDMCLYHDGKSVVVRA